MGESWGGAGVEIRFGSLCIARQMHTNEVGTVEKAKSLSDL
jgi:hypothetical protein